MTPLSCLLSRRSQPLLELPVPNAEQLAQCFAAAANAPDHRSLRPWRFLLVANDQRQALGELFYHSVHQQDPERARQEADRLKAMPLRAPMMIIAIFSPKEHPSIPRWEQWLSTGASVQNLLLALHAQGFAAIWRTGDLAENRHLATGLGLSPDEAIAGMIYLGSTTTVKAAPAKPEHVWSHWQPS